jgi:hypothetical protein
MSKEGFDCETLQRGGVYGGLLLGFACVSTRSE